jgi:hypothetical protein
LLNPRFAVYKAHWAELKPTFQREPTNAVILQKVDLLGTQLVKATASNGCTATITASGGYGAVVHYAKAHDADLGRAFIQLPGTTTIVRELEPAQYKFKAFRSGRETGKTGVIACTGRHPVEVAIVE